MASSPVPKAEQYLDAGFNTLLIGLHGTGKTTAVLDMAKAKGMKVKLFTCSTLDVYTDLVGVPVPRVGEDGNEHLVMVRPREIDEADFIFFDELNRADTKTLNAILEIIQFRSINGEELPNLRCSWAAMNPPGEEYQVEDLDPALIDRFDVFVDVQAKPSVAYMAQFIDTEIAKVLVNWWQQMDHKKRIEQGVKGYISPRRLLKLGVAYEKLGDFGDALPKWIDCERGKLREMLQQAEAKRSGQEKSKTQGGFGKGATDTIEYSKPYLKQYETSVANYLTGNPDDLDTHNAVLAVVESCHAPVLTRDYSLILTALKPSVLEAYLAGMASPKLERFQREVNSLPGVRQQKVAALIQAVDRESRLR